MDSAAFLSLYTTDIFRVAVLNHVGYEAIESTLCFFMTLDVISEREGQKSNSRDTVLIGQ